MTSTETKAAIQTALKNIGYTNKQVSIKIRRGSLEAMLIVSVRNESVNFEQVEAVAESFEKVYRCEATGEILGGGNVFIHVRRDFNKAA